VIEEKGGDKVLRWFRARNAMSLFTIFTLYNFASETLPESLECKAKDQLFFRRILTTSEEISEAFLPLLRYNDGEITFSRSLLVACSNSKGAEKINFVQ